MTSHQDDSAAPAAYEAYYRQRSPAHVYAVEFVVRAFLGNYPRLPRPSAPFAGRVLDLGFGDGRNMPLLAQLGLEVHGVEITQQICDQTSARMRALGVAVETRVGRNCRLPYPDAWFDHVLACHSCYYVDPGTRFSDNLREIARVTRPGGRFVFSAPMADSYILRGAADQGDGHMVIANDPYGLRVGAVLKKFDRDADIAAACDEWFTDVRVGSCRNDFWGIEEYVWIVVCQRRG